MAILRSEHSTATRLDARSPVTPEKAYAEIVALSRTETLLASCLDLLEWDEETSMPRNGVAHRAEQRALLAGLVHDRGTDPRYDELLSAVEGSALVNDAESPAAVNVREIRRAFDRERRLPRELVEEMARVTAMSQQAWAEARRSDDYSSFAPWLERVFALAREKADAIGHDGTRYDALLDDFEPGMTTDRLKVLFADLAPRIAPLLASLRDAPAQRNLLARDFSVDRQKGFAERTAATLGFHPEGGRLDVSQHPFCTMIGPGDVRIALRYHHATSGRDSSRCSTSSGTRSTIRGSTPRTTARRWERRPRSACTSRSPGCGRTTSAAAKDSGSTSIRFSAPTSSSRCTT